MKLIIEQDEILAAGVYQPGTATGTVIICEGEALGPGSYELVVPPPPNPPESRA